MGRLRQCVHGKGGELLSEKKLPPQPGQVWPAQWSPHLSSGKKQSAALTTDGSGRGHLSPLPALWLQGTFLTSLTLVFLSCKMGRIMVPSLAEL